MPTPQKSQRRRSRRVSPPEAASECIFGLAATRRRFGRTLAGARRRPRSRREMLSDAREARDARGVGSGKRVGFRESLSERPRRYQGVPTFRRHPRPLLLYRSICDFWISATSVRPSGIRRARRARRLFVARREDGTRAVCPTPQKSSETRSSPPPESTRHKGTSSCRSQTWRSARRCSRCASSSRGPRSSSSRRRLPTCSCRSAIRSSIRRRSSGGPSWRSRSSRRVASSSARPSTTRTAREDSPRPRREFFCFVPSAELAKTVPPAVGGKRRPFPPMIFAQVLRRRRPADDVDEILSPGVLRELGGLDVRVPDRALRGNRRDAPIEDRHAGLVRGAPRGRQPLEDDPRHAYGLLDFVLLPLRDGAESARGPPRRARAHRRSEPD
mmetsp:Transcript_11640/g.35873  ORF Transcript_11640/g.35873 Transcript_11640/m.35873 type:complete len:386 (+) Transcript_11640:879-2036(+)